MALLFEWRIVRVDLEFVYYYIRTDFGYVFVRPIKAVVMLFEELDECKADFGAEECSNLDLVIRKVGMNADIIKLIYAWLIGIHVLSRGRL